MTGVKFTPMTIVYTIMGLQFLHVAYLSMTDKKHQAATGTAVFWGLLGVATLAGEVIPPAVVGVMVAVMAILPVLKKVLPGSYKEVDSSYRWAEAKRLGAKPLLAVLVIPIVTFIFTPITSIPLAALVGLGVGSILACFVAMGTTTDSFNTMLNEGRRITDAIGWAIILPPYLAALGALFNKAGVGQVVASLVSSAFPMDVKLMAIVAYALGMALFTIIMGNAFAAFAVITTGIGIPLLIKMHGANPNIIAPLAMTAGYCGTLCTVMAANFNVVPAALLELKDKYGVIKGQLGVAIPLWVIHVLLMYFLAF